MMKLPIYILAGGRSSRFGSDKARAVVAGRPLLVGLAHVLKSRASRLTVIAEVSDKYADLGLTTLADVMPGRAPLGGLHTALQQQRESGWFLLAACDLVAVRSHWLDLLWAHCSAEDGVVAFRSTRRWEPLFALYHTSIGPTVTEALANNQLAMQSLLDRVGAVAVKLPADWPTVSQINTHDDLEDYLRDQQDARDG